jgi:hypothetical protein
MPVVAQRGLGTSRVAESALRALGTRMEIGAEKNGKYLQSLNGQELN